MLRYKWVRHTNLVNEDYYTLVVGEINLLELYKNKSSHYKADLDFGEFKTIDLKARNLKEAKQECVYIFAAILKKYVDILEGENNE